jgi:hypothetical protein
MDLVVENLMYAICSKLSSNSSLFQFVNKLGNLHGNYNSWPSELNFLGKSKSSGEHCTQAH